MKRIPMVLVVLALVPMIGCSSPWKPLLKKFATSEALPQRHHEPEAVALTAAAGGGRYSYDGNLAYALTDRGFMLQFGGIRFDRGTVNLPVSSIAACSRTLLPSRRYTDLWLPDPGIEVSVADADKTILGWCTERGIAVVEKGALLRMMFGPSVSERAAQQRVEPERRAPRCARRFAG